MVLKRHLTDQQASLLSSKFLTDDCFDTLITSDADGYSTEGELLFKFRKNVIPFDILKTGAEAFAGSITWTEGRGGASGYTGKRKRSDGSYSNTNVGNFVESGNVGFMDANAMVRYCRTTAFARDYFERFQEGIPFVQEVDRLYKELCPEHYSRQIAIARGTNRNYVIPKTSFTTVTVNRNFQTAVHKDSGDFMRGFGNLCVYREGSYDGCYFVLPEFKVAVAMDNCDMLFVDVHRWHGNTPFRNGSPGYIRQAHVMYYRANMINCKQPAQELLDTKIEQGGFLKL
jgi:hypothetical protein